MRMGITVVLLKLVFCCVKGFRTEQRAVIGFCVKLKKTATETFEMLQSVYSEECLLRANVFEWHIKGSKKLRK
jgi:hypothetical protein